MRLDKYLKVSRLIKRRTVAKEMASQGRIQVNGQVAKPGTVVKAGDVLRLAFGQGASHLRVLGTPAHVRKEEAESLYELLPDNNLVTKSSKEGK